MLSACKGDDDLDIVAILQQYVLLAMQNELAVHGEVEQLIALVTEIEAGDDVVERSGVHRHHRATTVAQRFGQVNGDHDASTPSNSSRHSGFGTPSSVRFETS